MRRKGPTTEWKVCLPAELALNCELMYYNPTAGKPKYGARSALVTKLLEAYWESIPPERRREILTPPQPLGVMKP